MGIANGTYSGGFTLNVTGGIARDADAAVSLNGSTGYLQIADAAALKFTGAFSLEAWANLNAVPAGLISRNDAISGNHGYVLYVLGNGALDLQINANSCTSSATLSLGIWHHLVGTYDGTNMAIYIDGKLSGGPQANAAPSVAALAMTLGAIGLTALPPTLDFLGGSLDEVAVYNYALSAGQVSAHFAAGTNPSLPAPLVAGVFFGPVSRN